MKSLLISTQTFLITLFVYTHKPFDYILVESKACGTHALTYSRQGSSRTVIHGVAEWFANSDEELVNLAIRI
jgi:hypothetical protein